MALFGSSIFTLILSVVMTLFGFSIRRDSVSLLRCPLRILDQVFSREISSLCCLKYPYSCFSSHFFFPVIVQLIPLLLVILLAAVISLSLLFSMQSSISRIDAFTQSLMLASPLPSSFLDIYNLSMLSLRCKDLCIFLNFLILWYIFLSSLVCFKTGPENLLRSTALVFIPLMRFLLQILVSRSFLVHLRYS